MATKRRRVAPGIYEVRRGVYELVVSLGKTSDGRYRQRTHTLRGTLSEAKKARVHLLAEVDLAPAGESPASMTFAQLLDRHIERVATAGGSPHTASDYRGMARNHLLPVLGDVPIDRLRTIDFDNLYDDLTTVKGLRPASVRNVHTLARGALRQALRWGLVATNVAAAAAPPIIRPAEIRVPSPQDVQKLILSAEEPWATLLRVAVWCGPSGVRRSRRRRGLVVDSVLDACSHTSQEFGGNRGEVGHQTRFEQGVLFSGGEPLELFCGPNPLAHAPALHRCSRAIEVPCAASVVFETVLSDHANERDKTVGSVYEGRAQVITAIPTRSYAEGSSSRTIGNRGSRSEGVP